MLCESCGQETAANLAYCAMCGHEHNLSFDEVQELMEDQITYEREESTEGQIRQFLLATLFILMCTWIIDGLYQDPKECFFIPLYTENIVVGERIVIPGSVKLIQPNEKNPEIKRPKPK